MPESEAVQIDVRHEQGGRWLVTYHGPRTWSQPELFGG